MTPISATRMALTGLVGVLGSLAAGPAFAQSPAQALFDNRFVISLGTFVVGTELEASLDGDVNTGNETIDFDEEFGLGRDATRWRLDALWRITPKHQLRFSYFDTSNSRSKTIDRDIDWGDLTFTAGGRVKAEFETDIYVLSYEYAFIREPSYEVAVGLGVHYSDISLKLSGNATLTDENGNVIDQGVTSKAANAPAPLPMIGLRGSWVVSPRWLIDLGGAFFKADYEGIDGNWFQGRVGATWMYNNNFGIGAGYSYFRTEVDVDKNSFHGSLTTSYSGLQIYVTGTF